MIGAQCIRFLFLFCSSTRFFFPLDYQNVIFLIICKKIVQSCLMPQCECMLNDYHLNVVFGQGGIVQLHLWDPISCFFFSPPYITGFYFFHPLHTRTTTIQPVHSGGCHSNRAASLSILCPVSPLRLSFPGGKAVWILHANRNPLIELRSEEVEEILNGDWMSLAAFHRS